MRPTEKAGRTWVACGGVVAVLACAGVLYPSLPAFAAAGELGQEMKQVQDDLLKKAGGAEAKPSGAVSISGTNSPAAAPVAPEGPLFKITTLEIRGDEEVLARAGLLGALKSEIEGRTLGVKTIRDIASHYGTMLITNQVNGGYLGANVSVPPVQDFGSGKVVINVTGGNVGQLAFYDKPEGTNAANVPFRGRYFSQRQIERKLAAVTNEPFFNYNTFYHAMLELNGHPDLNIDTDLKLRSDRKPGQPEQRFIDMDYKIGERLPVHAVLSLANNGTDVTSEWRAGLTAQHLNLTKHDDVLTISIPVSFPDVSVIQSVAASYYLPHEVGHGGAFTLFGGYSRLEADDLFNSPDPASRLSSSGRGYFGGVQLPFTLVRSADHQFSLSPGVTYRVVEDTLELGDGDASIDRNLTLTPFSVTLTYNTAGDADSLGGRNFVALETSYNPGDMIGGSGDEEIVAQRAAASSEYFVERLHFARLQPFAGRRDARGNLYAQWLLFTRAEAQYASEPLIPADQFGLGGLDSVRGYPDRVVLGDDGISGTFEFRTPIISGLIFRNAGADDGQKRRWFAPADRLQFVTFVDAGYLKVKEALEGESDSESLLSAGAGFRLQFTENVLARADWGIPFGYSDTLKETSGGDVKSSGRGHFSVQMQF